MMILEKDEICPFTNKCPVSKDCMGTFSNRETKFQCAYIDDNKVLQTEKTSRNIMDKTGTMTVLMENSNGR